MKELRTEVAAERKAKETETQLAAELAKRDGAMEERRAQAERAGSLAGENRTLREEFEGARKRLGELESTVGALKAEREGGADKAE